MIRRFTIACLLSLATAPALAQNPTIGGPDELSAPGAVTEPDLGVTPGPGTGITGGAGTDGLIERQQRAVEERQEALAEEDEDRLERDRSRPAPGGRLPGGGRGDTEKPLLEPDRRAGMDVPPAPPEIGNDS